MNYVNKNPLIICICGKARSGKSTISRCLEKLFIDNKKKVIVSPYTKYLKKYIEDITGNVIDEDNKPRNLLQNLSSELIKGILNDNDFFIRRQIEDINFYSYFADVILINDVRFPREIDVLKRKYDRVISIGVKRNNFNSGLTIEEKNDITEVSLDNYNNYDYVIENNGFDELDNMVKKLFNDIIKR